MSSDYTPQAWMDNDPTKPVSAARMTVIEDGLQSHSHPGAGGVTVIASITVAVAGVIDFQNIPQIYRHLRVVGSLRSAAAGQVDNSYLLFNNDTGTDYYGASLRWATGSTLSEVNFDGTNGLNIGQIPGSLGPANLFAAVSYDLPNYTDTAKLKVLNGRWVAGGSDNNSSTVLGAGGGTWGSTAAVTRLTFEASGSGPLAVGSELTLYGLG